MWEAQNRVCREGEHEGKENQTTYFCLSLGCQTLQADRPCSFVSVVEINVIMSPGEKDCPIPRTIGSFVYVAIVFN